MATKKYDSREVWTERIVKQQSSGMPQQAWCQSENLSVSTFRSWVRRLGMQPGKTKINTPKRDVFVKVVPPKEFIHTRGNISAGESEIELSIVRLRLPSDYSQSALRELLAGLAER